MAQTLISWAKHYQLSLIQISTFKVNLSKKYFSVLIDIFTFHKNAESFPKAITGNWLLPDGQSAAISAHLYLSFSKYLPESVNCEGKSFERQGQYFVIIQHTA